MARFYATDGTLLNTGPVMSRNHAVGQGVRFDSIDYKVLYSHQAKDGDEEVTVEPCVICQKCGGVVGNLDKNFGCNPSFCR